MRVTHFMREREKQRERHRKYPDVTSTVSSLSDQKSEEGNYSSFTIAAWKFHRGLEFCCSGDILTNEKRLCLQLLCDLWG